MSQLLGGGKNAKVDSDVATNRFTVSNIENNGTDVVITYQTFVSEEAYDNGYDLGINTAWFTFAYDGKRYQTSDVTADVGSGIAGQGTSPLVKTNGGYEKSTRSVTWTVTINPHKANFTSGIFVDDLSDVGGFADHKHQKGLELVGGIDDIKLQLDGTDLTDEDLVKLTYSEQKLTIEVGNLGKRTLTLTYTTKVCDPCLFANKVDGAGLTNKIITTDMVIADKTVATPEKPCIAESQVVFWVEMLKKNAPTYDYATGEMTWTVDVNFPTLPLTDIILTDELQQGLSYVEGSLQTSPEISNATASQEGQTLCINLGDFSCKTTVTFKTKVDWDVMDFDGETAEVKVKNEIKLYGKADGVDFKDSHSVKRTFVNHGLVKKDMVNEAEELINYEVLINPYGLTLPDHPTLVDTLDKKLQLDWDSLKLYKVTVSGTIGEGDQTPTYIYTEADLLQTLTVKAYDAETNQFTVELPIPEGGEKAAYVLTYTADMIDYQSGTYSNRICFEGHTALFGGTRDNSANVSGGGGGGVAARKATLSIKKVDVDNNIPLEGVTFMLYQWDGTKKGLAFAKGITDSDGMITFRGLKPEKTYVLEETSSLINYKDEFTCSDISGNGTLEKNGKYWIVTAGTKNTTLNLILTNEAYKADIKVNVTTSSGILPAGQSMTLENATTTHETKVSEDGTVDFSGVRPGTYELKDPDGNTIAKVEVTLDDTSVNVKYWDVDGNEITDPSDRIFTVKVPETNLWTLAVTKVAEDGTTPLSDAVFGLYKEENCITQYAKATSAGDGTLTFSGLMKGQSYYLKEVMAPKNYQLDTTVYTVDDTKTSITITNAKLPIVSIKKVDDSDSTKRLANVTFELYLWENGERGVLFKKDTTNPNGEINFTGLTPNAQYELVETEAAFGYSSEFSCDLDSNQIKQLEDGTWIITAGNINTNLNLTLKNKAYVYSADVNDKYRENFTFKLVTEDEIPMNGQKVTLVDSTGKYIEIDIEEDGTVNFSGVPSGTYDIKDPTGTKIAQIIINYNGNRSAGSHGFSFTVYKYDINGNLDNTTSVDLGSDTFLTGTVNSATTSTHTLHITKISSTTKRALSGARFGLYVDSACTKPIKQVESDSTGKSAISGLLDGTTYYLKEITAPSGYQLSNTVYTVTVNGADVSLTIENTPKSSGSSSNSGSSSGSESTNKPNETPNETPDDVVDDSDTEDDSDTTPSNGSHSGSSSHKGNGSASTVEEAVTVNVTDEVVTIIDNLDVPKTGDPTWWIAWMTLFSGILWCGLTICFLVMRKYYEND